MDPATLLTIGSTLLGGLFGKPKAKYVVPDYAGIRSKAEAAGFNPLTALTQGPQGSVIDTNAGMGSAIAEAGLMLADNLSKASAASKLQQAQGENAKLRAKVQSLTLRLKVGGVYAARESTPSLGAALGRSNAANARASGGGVSGTATSSSVAGGGASGSGVIDLPSSYVIDPRREVQHKPVASTSGFMVIDSPLIDRRMYIPTLDGDEPLQAGDLPSLAASYYFSPAIDRFVSNQSQPKRPSMDAVNPSAKSVAAGDRYNNALGRQRPGQWRDPGNPIRQHYKADTSAYWSWPTRNAWPKFQLGY
jgi:hypothetical protein